jgi:hypothetical protein
VKSARNEVRSATRERAIGALVAGCVESRVLVANAGRFRLSCSAKVVFVRMKELQVQETQIQDHGHDCVVGPSISQGSQAQKRRKAQEIKFDRPLQYIA